MNVKINANGPPLDLDGTASLLAFLLTGGDASGYLVRIREIQRQRKGGAGVVGDSGIAEAVVEGPAAKRGG